jgi:hypothetical protein
MPRCLSPTPATTSLLPVFVDVPALDTSLHAIVQPMAFVAGSRSSATKMDTEFLFMTESHSTMYRGLDFI